VPLLVIISIPCRTFGLQKFACWFVGGDGLTGALHVLQLQLLPPMSSSLAAVVSKTETFWYWLARVIFKGVGTNFGVGVGEARPKGMGSWGGEASHPHQLGGSRECCKLPEWGPVAERFLYSVPSDCLSQHLST